MSCRLIRTRSFLLLLCLWFALCSFSLVQFNCAVSLFGVLSLQFRFCSFSSGIKYQPKIVWPKSI